MVNQYLKHIRLLRDSLARVNGYSDAIEMGDYFDFEVGDDVLMKQADESSQLTGINIDNY